MWISMSVRLEESPAPGLGSASTRSGATSASVTLVSTSCTLEANINVTTLTSAPLDNTSAAAMLNATTYMAPTSANVKMDMRGMD